MNVKTLALAAVAAATATSVQAADLPMAAEPVNYVKACDAFGAGFFQLPGKETCIKLGGRIRANYVSHDFNQDLDAVIEKGKDAIVMVQGAAPITSKSQDPTKDVAIFGAGTSTSLATTKKALEAELEYRKAAVVNGSGTTATEYADQAAKDSAIKEVEDELKKVEDAREISAKVEPKKNNYSAYTKGYLYFTSMTNTEIGTIKTYTELTAKWDQDGNSESGMGDVYVQIGADYGSFLFGRESSVFDGFTGYTWIVPVGVSLSDVSLLQASFTADLGNGFTAAISAEESSYRGGEDNGLDIVGALKVTQGWGSFKLAAAAHNKNDDDGYGFAGGATAVFNLDMLKEGAEVSFQAQYADEAGAYLTSDEDDSAKSGWALSGGFETPLTEKLSAQLDVTHLMLDKDSKDYEKTSVNGSLVYSPVEGLGLALAAGWSQEDDNTDKDYDDVTKVGARVQYTF